MRDQSKIVGISELITPVKRQASPFRAIMIAKESTDGTVEVVSEGHWKLLNP